MKTTDNGRAEARSRANRRLQRMTIGTALAAVAATGGLGWLAAVTYDGTSTTAAGAVRATTTATDTAAVAASGTSTTSSTSTTSAAAPAVTTTGGSAHASTGGS